MKPNHPAELFFVLDHQDGWASHKFLLCGKRQENAKHAAFARRALNGNLTAVLIDDFGNNRQAEPHALGFRGEKWIENAFPIFRFDSRAAIDHGDFNLVLNQTRLHRDYSARRAGLRSVHHQVVEDTLQ